MTISPTTLREDLMMKKWRHDMLAYADEIAAMVQEIRPSFSNDKEAYAAFVRREFREAWEIFRRRHGFTFPYYPSESYEYRCWRDAVAVAMGWLHGRLGGPDKEWVRQRQLERAGQVRMFE